MVCSPWLQVTRASAELRIAREKYAAKRMACMDYFTWLYKVGARVVMDAEPTEPPQDREFEEKHPRTEKGQRGGGRFKTSNKTMSEQDVMGAKPRGSEGRGDGGGEEESYPSYSEVYDVYNAEGVSNRLMEMVERLHEGIIKGKVAAKRLPASVFRYPEMRMIPKWLVYAYLVASGAATSTQRTIGKRRLY